MRKGLRSFGAVAVVAALFGAPVPAARADTASGWAAQLSEALRQEDFEKIFTTLMSLKDEEFVGQLVDDPSACHVAMRGVARSIGKLAKEHDKFAEFVLNVLEGIGKGLKAKHADKPATSRALGALHAAKARYAWVAGKDFEIDDWEQALALTAKSYSGGGPVTAEEAQAAADGCVWMREANKHPKLKSDPSLLGALEPNVQPLIDVAIASTGDDARADVVRATARLLAAERAYKAGGASKATPFLEATFAALAPRATARSDAVVVSAYNDAVTFAKSYRIPAKAAYLMSTTPSTAGGLTYLIPAGSRWRTDSGGGTRDLGGFYAYDSMGRKVRQVSIEAYRWDRNYVVNETEKTGGDNAKGLAKMMLKIHKDEFATMKEIPLQKSSFGKKLPPGNIFELVGTDKASNYYRVRAIFVKGKESQVTFGITIVDMEDFGKTDAEMEAILDTFVEVKDK